MVRYTCPKPEEEHNLAYLTQATAQERNEMRDNYPLLPVKAGHLEAFAIG
jgi:hypothetical protein